MTRPLLIDADPGNDDAVALLLALESADLDVVGVTTVHGNAPVEDTTPNARSILEALDRADVPVATGADRPLVASMDTAEHIHGDGGIRSALPDPTPATSPVDVHAAQFIVDRARRHDGDLALAALGPLTNVALALAIEPDLPDLVDELIVMGGAAFTHGNVTPLAEANFHSDPEAARRVVRDAGPTAVGLDVTRRAGLPADWIDSLPRTELGRAVRAWLTYYPDEVLERYEFDTAAVHDALVIAALIEEGVLETETYSAEVGGDSELARGAFVVDVADITGEEPNARVAVDVDAARYRELVIDAVEAVLDA